jgi:hypothetical protein
MNVQAKRVPIGIFCLGNSMSVPEKRNNKNENWTLGVHIFENNFPIMIVLSECAHASAPQLKRGVLIKNEQ